MESLAARRRGNDTRRQNKFTHFAKKINLSYRRILYRRWRRQVRRGMHLWPTAGNTCRCVAAELARTSTPATQNAHKNGARRRSLPPVPHRSSPTSTAVSASPETHPPPPSEPTSQPCSTPRRRGRRPAHRSTDRRTPAPSLAARTI